MKKILKMKIGKKSKKETENKHNRYRKMYKFNNISMKTVRLKKYEINIKTKLV